MNCKRVQELLPLFAGRDLEDGRAQQVAAHVQTCAHCAGAADEYRETRQMLQQFSPPPFSEGVYAAMRQRVLREIAAESTAPTFSQLLAGMFRPRLTWAVAGALLITLAMFAILFLGHRQAERQQIARGSTTTSREQTNAPDKRVTAPSPARDGDKGHLAGGEPRRHYFRNRVADRPDAVALNAPDTRSTVSEAVANVDNSASPGSPSTRDLEKTLRVELQTKDPNIRIIWFSHPDGK